MSLVTAPKGKLMKLATVAGGGILVIGLVGGGGFYAYKKFFKKGPKPPVVLEAPAPVDPEAEDKAWEKKHPGAPTIMAFDRIVNLDSGRKGGFLKCTLNIVFRDPELGKLASGDKPSLEKSQIEALLLDKLSGLTVEEATDRETRSTLCKDLKDQLNEKFGPGAHGAADDGHNAKKDAAKRPVKDVLVVAWAVQL